jgi:hypothetical protein
MFGSNNFSVKKLAAFSAVLSIILMSCGGSSTSSNAGRSKNAALVDGKCVWNEEENNRLSEAKVAQNNVVSAVEKLKNDPKFNTARTYLAQNHLFLEEWNWPKEWPFGEENDPFGWTIDEQTTYQALAESDTNAWNEEYANTQQDLIADAEAMFLTVENELIASAAVDCAVKDEEQKLFDKAVENACSDDSNDNQQDEEDCDAALNKLVAEFVDKNDDFPEFNDPKDVVENLSSSGNNLEKIFTDTYWDGRFVTVELRVPMSLSPADYELAGIKCESDAGNIEPATNLALTSFTAQFTEAAGSCNYVIREFSTDSRSEPIFVSINAVTEGEPTTDQISSFETIDPFLGVVLSWHNENNITTVKLDFHENIKRERYEISRRGCDLLERGEKWMKVNFREGQECLAAIYDYETEIWSEFVEVGKYADEPADDTTRQDTDDDLLLEVKRDPYLGPVEHGTIDGGRSRVEVNIVIPPTADTDNVWLSIKNDNTEIPFETEEIFNNEKASATIKLGQSGAFVLYRGEDVIGLKKFKYEEPVLAEEKYSLDVEVNGSTLTIAVKMGELNVPKKFYSFDFVGFQLLEGMDASYNEFDRKWVLTGLIPGSEFELILMQHLFRGNFVADRKIIKIPGKSIDPPMDVPQLVAPVVAVIEEVSALPLLVDQLTSQVVSEDQAEIACDQTCVSAILATVDGEVFAQIDGGKEVQLDGTSAVKINSDSKTAKILVKPTDGSAVTEYRVALLRNTSSDGGPGSTSNANSSSMNWVYILIAILLLVIFGIVKQRRNPVENR